MGAERIYETEGGMRHPRVPIIEYLSGGHEGLGTGKGQYQKLKHKRNKHKEGCNMPVPFSSHVLLNQNI